MRIVANNGPLKVFTQEGASGVGATLRGAMIISARAVLASVYSGPILDQRLETSLIRFTVFSFGASTILYVIVIVRVRS